MRDPSNPKKRLSFWGDTKEGVIARAHKARSDRDDVRAGVVDPRVVQARLRLLTEGPYMIERAWKEYRAKKSPDQQRNTAGYWDNHFARFFTDMVLIGATEEVMAKWDCWMAERCAASTIGVVYSMLSAAIKLSIPHRISGLPWGDWRPSGEGKGSEERDAFRSIEEVRAVLLTARERDKRVRRDGEIGDWEARLTVATFSGMRQGEIGGLGWDCVFGLDVDDQAQHLLYIRYQVIRNWDRDHPEWTRPLSPPKSLERRAKKKKPIVPQRMHPDLVRVLRAQRQRLIALGIYREDGPVFPADKLGRWRVDNEAIKVEVFRSIVEESGVKCRLDRMTPHSLRHTFTTLEGVGMAQAGRWDPRALIERTRHTTVQMLEPYTHVAGRGLVAPQMPLLGMPTEDAAAEEATFEEWEPAEPPQLDGLTSEVASAAQRELSRAELARDIARDLKGNYKDADIYMRGLAEWNAMGRPANRKWPPVLSKHFNKKYSARYVEELRDVTGGNVAAATEKERAAARAAAIRTRRAAERRWTQYLRTADEGRLPVAKTKLRGGNEDEVEHG